ncbi:Modification methylase Eco57IB [Caulifigura coniformis]|uniref:Modification methylase Eco57IB n=1 Tax=Caulifigura coniformis TaxID=2527983 RepID=A0A517SCP0_9PLAN|nr:N-6 DNA methylase [Caulifigura coniformis]QDT53884.1 Modification methylase Eco57IB [Caulifigura coniformis]
MKVRPSAQLLIFSGNDEEEASPHAKALGAYYTDVQIADFLTWWAIRSPEDHVMDPSFGGGVFLRAACRQIRKLGGEPKTQVFGVEIDEEVFYRISGKLAEEYGLQPTQLQNEDFFRVEPQSPWRMSVIIGNPPFIRYQRFTGRSRERALARAFAEGITLPKLASSWAPFLLHSAAMLTEGGRLAMVLPVEITHAKYAQPILRHLQRSFRATTFITFKSKLFPDLSEDTLLLLAEGKGHGPGEFRHRDLQHAGALAEIAKGRSAKQVQSETIKEADEIVAGRQRLIEQLLPSDMRRLYRQLAAGNDSSRLGEIANVGIGYVTGANDFFHLSPDEAKRLGIPARFLKRVVRRGRSISGLKFTEQDWKTASANGEAAYLLYLRQGDPLPDNVQKYLEAGKRAGVAEAYKCRSRSPWYAVPHVHRPDGFLSYMSGETPHLVSNEAKAFAPNSLHIVRMRSGQPHSAAGLAALWQTSMTRLSVEIEGHALGGGMLKLEPGEAAKVLLAKPETAADELEELAAELDLVSRKSGTDAARKRADELILCRSLGLSRSDCRLLNSAAELLRDRRMRRSKSHELA